MLETAAGFPMPTVPAWLNPVVPDVGTPLFYVGMLLSPSIIFGVMALADAVFRR